MVNRVVPEGEHLEAALEMAGKITVIDTFSVALTKRAINRIYEIMGMCEALDAAREVCFFDRSGGRAGALRIHVDSGARRPQSRHRLARQSQ